MSDYYKTNGEEPHDPYDQGSTVNDETSGPYGTDSHQQNPSPYGQTTDSYSYNSGSYGEAGSYQQNSSPYTPASNSYQYTAYTVPKRRPRFIPYIALSLISALLGGVLSLGLAPSIYGFDWRSPSTGLTNQTNNTAPLIKIESPTSFPVTEISKAVGPAVVGVSNFQNQGGFFGTTGLKEIGSGSGFIIDAQKGYIVTNNHVIDGAEQVTVSLADGRILDAKLVGGDSRTDLAVLQIADPAEIKDLTQVQLGDSSQLQVGEPVVAIGNPGGEEFARSVTDGIVSALNRFLSMEGESSFNLIQTNAGINPGNSGGPLVNYQGQVIGINAAKNAEAGFEAMGFAIPISEALPIINQLIEKGYASHAGLLINVSPQYTPEAAKQQEWPEGAYVARATAGGPADKAGIKAGDIITKVNGVEISTSYELTRQLFKYKPGDTVTVTYYRNGQSFDTSVTLAEIRSE